MRSMTCCAAGRARILLLQQGNTVYAHFGTGHTDWSECHTASSAVRSSDRSRTKQGCSVRTRSTWGLVPLWCSAGCNRQNKSPHSYHPAQGFAHECLLCIERTGRSGCHTAASYRRGRGIWHTVSKCPCLEVSQHTRRGIRIHRVI